LGILARLRLAIQNLQLGTVPGLLKLVLTQAQPSIAATVGGLFVFRGDGTRPAKLRLKTAEYSNCRVGSPESEPANQMTIVVIAILCYLLASAFFLLCVMRTARGKEYGSRIAVPSEHSGALSSSATVAPSLRAEPITARLIG
jgi:hypothetical protein